MTITKAELKKIRGMAAASLQAALGDKYLVEEGNGKYGTMTVTFTLKVTKAGEEGIVPPLEQDFRDWASLFGLAESDFGAQFRSGKSWYRISGLKPNNRKYPIIADNVATGKSYKFEVDGVKQAKELGKNYWRAA